MTTRVEICKNATCPIRKTADLLSDIWTILIVRELILGPKHFCEIEKALEGISTRTLTLKLNALIEKGLVKKGEQYSLTKKGEKLSVIFDAMTAYGKKYLA